MNVAMELRGKRERLYRGGKADERSPVSWTKYLNAEILIICSGDRSKENGALTPALETKVCWPDSSSSLPCACPPLPYTARTTELINKLSCLWLLIE